MTNKRSAPNTEAPPPIWQSLKKRAKMRPEMAIGVSLVVAVLVVVAIIGSLVSGPRTSTKPGVALANAMDALVAANPVQMSVTGTGALAGTMTYVKNGSDVGLTFSSVRIGTEHLIVAKDTPYIKGDTTYWLHNHQAASAAGTWWRWGHKATGEATMSGTQLMSDLGLSAQSATWTKKGTTIIDGLWRVSVPKSGSWAPISINLTNKSSETLTLHFSYQKRGVSAPAKSVPVPKRLASYFSVATATSGWYRSTGQVMVEAPSFLGS